MSNDEYFKKEENKRREGEEKERERGNGFHCSGEDRMSLQMDLRDKDQPYPLSQSCGQNRFWRIFLIPLIAAWRTGTSTT